MKLILVMFFLSVQVFAHYAHFIYRGHHHIHRTHRAFVVHHPRVYYPTGRYFNYQEPREVISEKQGPSHDDKVKEANKAAEKRNKEKDAEFDKKTAAYEDAHPAQNEGEQREEIDFSKYKDSAQLIVGQVHLYGVTEVKTFKDDKILVKAANGNFAFPKKVYESAQKLNFDKVEK